MHKLKKFVRYRFEFIHLSRSELKIKKLEAQKELESIAKDYATSEFEQIILIHGTFVGDDPLLINRALTELTPKFFSPLFSLYRKILKKIFDIVGKDLGNFTYKHKNSLKKNFKQKISLFKWSGSNNHYGRFCGVVELIEFLKDESDKNYLIIAHSHGGQLLALMTQLFWDESLLSELLAEKLIANETIDYIKKVRSFNYTLVTMGSPVRYCWKTSSNVNILHFINHRGRLPIGGNLMGLLWNKRGDYIQQFGGAGSDLFSVIDMHSKLNKKLAFIFKDADSSVLSLPTRKQRLHHEGLNLLVDYRDAKIYPNFYKTIFGHGIYTR